MNYPGRRFNASHTAPCVARHGVRSHPVPVALVGECSIPVVYNVARQPRSSAPEELAALVEHGLLDHLVRPPQH